MNFRSKQDNWIEESANLAQLVPDAKVLFADDHEDTLSFMKEKSEQVGWDGDFVSNPQEVIMAFNRSCEDHAKCYDCIVLDINYEGQVSTDGLRFTGVSVAREIRKTRPDIPIIFVSAWLNNMTREEIRRIGAEALTKPIDPNRLFGLIAYVVCEYRNFLSDSGQMRMDHPIKIPDVLVNVIQEIRAGRERGGIGQ
jgi:CheY-like chemotaxis protein